MARITRAASHLPGEEVRARMKNDSRPWCRNKWLIIYNALVDPREATEIAKHTGVSVSTVHTVISDSNRFGVASVETSGKGGRCSDYLTLEEERDLLRPFFERAAKGEIATAAQINSPPRSPLCFRHGEEWAFLLWGLSGVALSQAYTFYILTFM